MYQDLQLYIDGVWAPVRSGAVKAVHDPATEEAVGNISDAGLKDLDRALAAAGHGFEVWRNTGPWERAAKLRKVSELIRERLDFIARLMSIETGRALAETKGETGAAADQFEWYAEETKGIYGQRHGG